MKKSIVVCTLALTLFIGILSTPAAAFTGTHYGHRYHGYYNQSNYFGTVNGYRVVPTFWDNGSGVILRFNNLYGNSYNYRVYQNTPVQPAPAPQPQQPVQTPNPQPQQPAPAPAPQPQPAPAPQGIGTQQSQMLNMVNQERTKAGLQPLAWDGNLTVVAQAKAKDMSDNNYFDHKSPTYGSPFEMMKNFGITYRAAGENLAGSGSVDRAHLGLMNSEGHRKNILNPNFTHIGIGVEKSTRYGYVYVQMFISK